MRVSAYGCVRACNVFVLLCMAHADNQYQIVVCSTFGIYNANSMLSAHTEISTGKTKNRLDGINKFFFA